jgi:hypothetical protein
VSWQPREPPVSVTLMARPPAALVVHAVRAVRSDHAAHAAGTDETTGEVRCPEPLARVARAVTARGGDPHPNLTAQRDG